MAFEFIELFYILLFSIIGGVLAARFKQPTVLGVLIAGALIGPHALNLIKSEELLNIAIELGAILLLFLVGIEFSLEKLIQSGTKAVAIAVAKLGILFFVGYQIALIFGFDALTALFIGVILSITSTVIFLKILEQKGMHKEKSVELLVSVLILEDIFGVFALTFFSSIAGAQITPLFIAGKLILAVIIISAVYLVIKKIFQPILNWLSAYSTEDTITFMAIGICAFMSYVAHFVGLSTAVGAFLAGNIVSSLRNADKFEKAIHPFILTFTSLFFFSIGAVVNFSVIFDHLGLILILFIVSVLCKFLVIGFAMYVFGDVDGRTAAFAGLSMVSLGEFSLLIANEANNTGIGIDLVSITAIIIFLSSLAMTVLVTKVEWVYRIINVFMPKGLRFDMQAASKYFYSLSVSSLVHNLRRQRIDLSWKLIVRNLIGILFIWIVILVWYNATHFQYIRTLVNFSPVLIVFIAIAIMLIPTFGLIRNVRSMVIEHFKSFLELYPNEIANEKKLFRNVILAIVLFLVTIIFPPIIAFAGLPSLYANLGIILIVVVIYLCIKFGVISKNILKHNKQQYEVYEERRYKKWDDKFWDKK